MLVKSFLTGKRGEGRYGIEDSIAIDVPNGRFAVSDGVTKSFLPQVWSNILTQAWISVDEVSHFPQDGLSEQFLQERNRIMELLDEDTRMDYEDLERKYRTASATFCGVELHEGVLKWVVIGDSCLFLLVDEEPPQCISSHPMPTDDMGHIIPYFDNNPYQILADGKVCGETRGERFFEKGTLLLMSDAMSAWFINAHNDGKDPLEQLMALTDDESFEQWVEKQYYQGLLASDDESVIIVQLEEVNEKEQIVVSGNLTPIPENVHTLVEALNVANEIIQGSNNPEEVSQEQTDNIEKMSTRKKRHWVRIAAFLRLCRIKYRNLQIKQDDTELQAE